MDGGAKLDRILRALERDSRFSGVVRVTRGTEELFGQAYGMASRTWSVPNSMDMRFDTASLTKLFTAVAILQHVDSRDISLDTPVIPFLGLSGTRIDDSVTPFQLLTHSSGIGDDCEEEAGEVYENLWKSKANYLVTETADFLGQFVHKPPNFPPGAGCRYCNCGYVLLGLILEKIEGRPYREIVRERIFAPAGMTRSDFFDLGHCSTDVAEGCDPVLDETGAVTAWKKNIYSFPPIGSPDSGAHVTAADLDRFLRAVKKAELLSVESAEAFFTPRIPYKDRDGWAMQYGLGMWFYVEPDGRVLCCQKEGYNAGVSAVMRYFIDRDVNVVILSNMADGAWDLAWTIHTLIIDGAFGT